MISDKAKSLLSELEQSLRSISSHSGWLYLDSDKSPYFDDISGLFADAPSLPQVVSELTSKKKIHEPIPNIASQISDDNNPRFEKPLVESVEDTRQPGPIDLNPITAKTIDSLHLRLKDCDRCPLWETRKTIVFGQGNINADLVFVGEGPGEEEDKSGLAFVGRAGKLLTQIIHSIGISRDSVFICNIVKCRPPGNRNPNPEEIETCSPFLFRQLELLQPKLIITLGNIATKTLLPNAAGIMRMRGKLEKFKATNLLPTFHPSYLLRNPAALSLVWDDMRLARQTLFTSSQSNESDA